LFLPNFGLLSIYCYCIAFLPEADKQPCQWRCKIPHPITLCTRLRVVATLTLEEFLMIRDLYNQGLNISQIAHHTGFDRKTVRKHLLARTPPALSPRARKPSKLDDYRDYILRGITDYPLSAARAYREIQDLGFTGKYTIVKAQTPHILGNILSSSVSAIFRTCFGTSVIRLSSPAPTAYTSAVGRPHVEHALAVGETKTPEQRPQVDCTSVLVH